MPDEPLAAHSLAEAYLYLMATPCGVCGRGPLEGTDPYPEKRDESEVLLNLKVTCASCGHHQNSTFRIPADAASTSTDAPPVVNQSDEPSRIIDVAQWITLFRAITEVAGREKNKREARRLGIEAAMCLEEALKFYDEDNDLPPSEALFHENSRNRLRDYPEQFSRQRLINLRRKLPSMSIMMQRLKRGQGKKRPWWRFGR
ncbi:MAG: hypothetical protein JSV78_05105 [Phycisphaerales bacterium]|nr:MAG: hypothetical protein JSV78_05105 [Phycisphaerales bacterium]